MKQLILLFFIILSHVSITFSQKAEKLFENGKISYKERNYEAALKDFDQCIEKEGLADCYAWRATTYYALKKYDNALQDINTAFSKNSDPPAWYYTAKGRIYINMREYKTALPFIQKAIDMETGDKPYYERGYIYYYTYEYNKALTDFTSALNQKPFALAIYYRGLTYQTLGNMENALKDARMINEKYADSYLGFFLMGYIYLYDRKYDQAINSLEEALKKQPRDMLTFEYLGKAYYYKNDF